MHPATKADEECVWKGGERSSLRDAALRARARSATTVALTEGAFSWKGFFSRERVEALEALGVSYALKVPDHAWVRSRLSPYRRSTTDPALWTTSGRLYRARLLTTQQRREIAGPDELAFESYEVENTAHVLTNVAGIPAVTAWRLYNVPAEPQAKNQGALVEQRIEELGQLSVGQTAVDDLGGNHLLWALGALAYEMLHWVRTTALSGSWRRAQPKRLRTWLFRLPAKLTSHARKQYVQLQRTEPLRRELLRALCRIGTGPPLPA